MKTIQEVKEFLRNEIVKSWNKLVEYRELEETAENKEIKECYSAMADTYYERYRTLDMVATFINKE